MGMSASSKPTAIAIPNELKARIMQAAALMKRPQQDVMRTAMDIGLRCLASIDYDIEGAVWQTVSAHLNKDTQGLNEEPTTYTARAKQPPQ